MKKHKSTSRRKQNRKQKRGYITFLLLLLTVVAVMFAGSFVFQKNSSTNNTAYMPGNPTPYGGYNSLELHSVPFISLTPVPPTPTTQLTSIPSAPNPSPLSSITPPQPSTSPIVANGLRVQGNTLVNGTNQVVRLHGVDRSGTEYMCVQNGNIFDGPSDTASIQAMKAWNANVVRVPLNEDCWLGINGANTGGTTYQQAIKNFVTLINQNGLYVILDLHWNAPGTTKATGQQNMADTDHSIAFWTSVAQTFNGNNNVIFDLYNEPHGISWSCWKDGTGCSYAGMQQMVSAVRSAGATNILMLGGLQWSNDLTGWLANKPSDPLNNIAASWHSYNFNTCNNTGCFTSQIAPVAAQVPVITGEMGENDCAHGYVDNVMSWLDSQQQSYVGWSWNVAGCGGFPSLITDYGGTPTNFGIGLKNHYLTLP